MTVASELRTCLHEIERVIEAVKDRVARDGWAGASPYASLDVNGRPVLADLLVAKAHLLTTLALVDPPRSLSGKDLHFEKP